MAAKARKTYRGYFILYCTTMWYYLSLFPPSALAKPLKPEIPATPTKNQNVNFKETKATAAPKTPRSTKSRLKSNPVVREKKSKLRMKSMHLPYRLGFAVGGAGSHASGPMVAGHLNWRRWQWFVNGSAHQLQQLNGLGEVVIAHNRYSAATGGRYVFTSGLSIGLGYEVSWLSFEYLNPRADPNAAFTFISSSQSACLDFAWQSQGSRFYLIMGMKPSVLVKESDTFEWSQITSDGDWRQSAETLWDRNIDPSYLYVAIGFYVL